MIYEPIIGLEIHVEMKTASKMFSSAPYSFSKEPNTQVAPLDMAFPGTMPVVNKQAVVNGIRVAHALHMDIERTLLFDRKNYFYSDLPKGYQITQEERPLGRHGYLTIVDASGQEKRIGIERLHLEEDTCKQLHMASYSLLDYNRAGVPLLEIVSLPEIRNGFEAMRYVEAIRNIVVYSGCSDGKMEEGSLRVDVNVSLRPQGEDSFGTKVELKNLNSLRNIGLAIDYEIKRQAACLEGGVPISQETRRYDEASGQTVPMRIKSDAVDYKCFCESNLPPIALSEGFIAEAIDTCPELYEGKKRRYLGLGLTPTDVAVILDDMDMARFFESALGENEPKAIANFLIVEINGYLNKRSISMADLRLPPSSLCRIAAFQKEGYSHRQCVDILMYCLDHEGVTPEEAKAKLGIEKQISDEAAIRGYVTKAIAANPQSVADFFAGKDRAKGYLIGQAMKLSGGKIHPAVCAKVMDEELNRKSDNFTKKEEIA